MTKSTTSMDDLMNHLHPDEREEFIKYTGKFSLAWLNYLDQKRARDERIKRVGQLDATPEERASAKLIRAEAKKTLFKK